MKPDFSRATYLTAEDVISAMIKSGIENENARRWIEVITDTANAAYAAGMETGWDIAEKHCK